MSVPSVPPTHLCQCGCGSPAPIANQSDTKRGYVKGEPRRFISGHNSRGSQSPHWQGGRYTDTDGYILIHTPDHPRSRKNGYVLEHLLVTEKALGKPLPPGAVVHHANGDPSDNRPSNLVVCEDNVYHLGLHVRIRALAASGHVDWRKCKFCGEYDDPNTMYLHPRSRNQWHRECRNSRPKT